MVLSESESNLYHLFFSLQSVVMSSVGVNGKSSQQYNFKPSLLWTILGPLRDKCAIWWWRATRIEISSIGNCYLLGAKCKSPVEWAFLDVYTRVRICINLTRVKIKWCILIQQVNIQKKRFSHCESPKIAHTGICACMCSQVFYHM